MVLVTWGELPPTMTNTVPLTKRSLCTDQMGYSGLCANQMGYGAAH